MRTAGGTRTGTPAGQVVADLVTAGLVDPARTKDAEDVVARTLATPSPAPGTFVGTSPATASHGRQGLLVEIAAYVGGALVVAAVGLFLAQEWSAFSDAARVATLGTITLLLAAAGLAVSWLGGGYAELRAGRDEVRRRLASALLVAAAVAAGVTVGQQVDVVLGEGDFSEWPAFVAALVVVLAAAGAYAWAPSALAVLAVAAAVFQAVVMGWNLQADETTVPPGLTLLAAGAVGVLLTERRLVREAVVGRLLGVGFALLGAQMVMFEGGSATLAYALTALVAVAGFGMYLRTTAWPYLVGGVTAVTIVVPEAVIDWTGGAMGPAGGVLVAGLALLGASLAGFRLRRDATDGHPETDR